MKTNFHTHGLAIPRRLLGGGLGAVLAGLILAGCSPGIPPKIVIRGSNTIGEELAPRLIAEFKQQHPAITFDLEFKGTTYGFGALLVDRCDIAAASRPASTNESELARSRGIELQDHVIGAYSVAVIVNAASPLANLTPEQVRDVFTGAAQNWKDVGGPDAPVHLYVRDPISGTHLGFRELAMENKPYALGLKTCTNYSEIVQAVARDANGVGYVSFDQTTKPGVKPVAIGGVAPTAQTVNSTQYPYERVLRLYTSKGRESDVTRAFLDFVLSARGQEIVAQAGYTRRP
jgi:phosphate transport system substrate-binding protein